MTGAMEFAWRDRVLATVVAVGAAAAAPAWADGLTAEGVWRNPKDTVHIELKPCGAEVCGYVVWASEHAERTARKAGSQGLVGQQLLRDFTVGRDRVGRGKVYVPDLKTTFSGTATQLDARTLKAKGCIVANLVCKSQVWTRIDNAPS